MTIDTLKLARNLQRHEFSQAQAEGLAEELRSSFEEGVATKSDIESLRKDTKADIESLRKDTKSGIESLRKDTKSDIESLRKDTKSDIESLRKDTKAGIESLRKDTKAEIESVRTELRLFREEARAEFALVREEMRGMEDRISLRMIKWMVGIGFVLLGAFGGATLFLARLIQTVR